MNDVKEFRTIRLVFSKTGRARYMSHLDLNRAMIRALRRAKLPVWYTEGFNRHPYVTFAAPLSLGYEGLHETMDLRLEEDVPMEELVSRLGAVLPEGLRALSAAAAVRKPGEVAAARYELLFSCPACAVRALLERDSLPVQKRTKKKTMRTVDLKPALTASGWELREEGDGCRLELTLPCGTESLNPGLLTDALRALPGMDGTPCRIRRLEVYGSDGEPFR